MLEKNYSQYLQNNSPLINAKKIAIMVLDGLGDSILSLPAIRFLVKACPQSEILVIASKLGAPVFTGTAQTIVFNPKELDFKSKLTETLRQGHFDAVLCFTEKGYALSAVYQSGIPVRCGFFPGLSQPLKSLALLWQLNYRVPFSNNPHVDQKIHQTTRFFLLLEKLGIKIPAEADFPDLTLELSPEYLTKGRQALAASLGLTEAELKSHRLCAIQLMPRWHPNISETTNSDRHSDKKDNAVSGTVATAKHFSPYWPLLQSAALLYKKLCQSGYAPIFSCAPNDRVWVDIFAEDLRRNLREEKELIAAADGATQSATEINVPVFSNGDLYIFAAFLKNCRFLVTPDGGSAHVAAAIKLPEVVFFPANNLKRNLTRWKPWRTTCEVVVKQDKNQDDETLSQNLYEACKKICP